MFLTIKEVAAELKISLSLAYRLVATGEIPAYEFASCKRVSAEDLQAYLDRQKPNPTRLPKDFGKHF